MPEPMVCVWFSNVFQNIDLSPYPHMIHMVHMIYDDDLMIPQGALWIIKDAETCGLRIVSQHLPESRF